MPFLVLAGSGFLSLRLLKRQPSLALIVFGVLYLIPLVRQNAAGPFWLFFKVALFVCSMIWFRGTFPRFRYDQLMNIGWKYMIPIGMGAILVNAVVGMVKD